MNFEEIRYEVTDHVLETVFVPGCKDAGREIEIENQTISKKGEGLAIGNQLRDTLLHDGDLHVAVAMLRAAPCVAGYAIIGRFPW